MQELGRNTTALYNFLGQKMPPLKYQYRELGVVHCIRGEADPAFISSLSEAEEECLYQKNICWKYPWSMKYRGME